MYITDHNRMPLFTGIIYKLLASFLEWNTEPRRCPIPLFVTIRIINNKIHVRESTRAGMNLQADSSSGLFPYTHGTFLSLQGLFINKVTVAIAVPCSLRAMR